MRPRDPRVGDLVEIAGEGEGNWFEVTRMLEPGWLSCINLKAGYSGGPLLAKSCTLVRNPGPKLARRRRALEQQLARIMACQRKENERDRG